LANVISMKPLPVILLVLTLSFQAVCSQEKIAQKAVVDFELSGKTGAVQNIEAVVAFYRSVKEGGAEGERQVPMDRKFQDATRAFFIYLFDSAQFHQMKGSKIPELSQEEIKKQLVSLQEQSFFEIALKKPTTIEVEGKSIEVQKFWASVRKKDGLSTSWVCATADGKLVSLSKVSGSINSFMAPQIKDFMMASP